MRVEDFPKNTPHLDLISEHAPPVMADGGSCIAAPDGTWVVEPVVGREALIISEIDFNRVLEERHNFDPAGHYSRSDVIKLTVNRERQRLVDF